MMVVALVDVALDYARRGWPVFPLEPRGKRPAGSLVPHGLKDASDDEERVRAWWKAMPEANIGCPTGVAFDALDADTPEASEAFIDLCAEHDLDPLLLPRTRTGSGGRHVLFQPTGVGNRARFLESTDWRGRGGYIVLPGSIHPSGSLYEWIVEPGEIPVCPDWLLALLRKPDAPEHPAIVSTLDPPPPAYIDRAVDAEMQKLRSTPEGARNDQLNRSAFALGTMIGAGWLDRGRAEAELRAAAFAIDHGREPGLSATIRSGLESGIRNPRIPPPDGWGSLPSLYVLAGTSATNGATALAPQPSAASDNASPESHSSWAPVDLASLLHGDLTPLEPVALARADGIKLLYPGRVHTFLGEPESCKSWAAQIACAEAILDDSTALYIDFEAEARDVVGHLRLLGLSDALILEHLIYIRPDEPWSTTARDEIEKALTDRTPTIAVLDGMNNSMVANGLEPNSTKDVATWWQMIGRPIQLRVAGPTVIIDHVAKNRDGRGDWAIGAGHKKALVDGASLGFEIVQKFGRGRTGIIKIRVLKDRPGFLRGHQGNGDELGRLRLISSGDGPISYTLDEPEGGEREPGSEPRAFRPTALMERVSRHLETFGERSGRQVTDSIQGKAQYVRKALEILTEEGFLAVESGPKRALIYRSLRPYYEAEELIQSSASPVRPSASRDAVASPPLSASPDRVSPVGDAGRTQGDAVGEDADDEIASASRSYRQGSKRPMCGERAVEECPDGALVCHGCKRIRRHPDDPSPRRRIQLREDDDE